jgi:hypothetical protein
LTGKAVDVTSTALWVAVVVRTTAVMVRGRSPGMAELELSGIVVDSP